MVHPFAFEHLKTYASDEVMLNGSRCYAAVFEWENLQFCRVELAFWNKKLGEMAWTAEVVFKLWDCNEANPRIIYSKEHTQVVSPNDKNVIFRESWGSEIKGTAFSVGRYRWTAWLNGVEVGKTDFFVNGVGKVSASENPYFEINDLQLYAGNSEAWKSDKKQFLSQIDKQTTEYLWLQFGFRNMTGRAWRYEIHFLLRDHKGTLKGKVTRTGEVSANKKFISYNFDIAWGCENVFDFLGEYYHIEVLFMDYCLATAFVPTGNQAKEGKLSWQKGHLGASSILETIENAPIHRPLPELLAELHQLTGLDSIKTSIQSHLTYTRFIQLRQSRGLDKNTKFPLHAVFTGNPGTGKTTVIKLLGQIYYAMGLLSKGHVQKADRADLIGEYIGQTAPKVKKVIEESRGGVLFVDEAYALLRDETDVKDFGREALEILMMEMSDGEGDIAIIFAGYPREIHKLLHANPGLKSRFQHFYHFEDYPIEALFSIALNHAKVQDITLHPSAKDALKQKIEWEYERKDETFGNARFAKQLIDSAKVNMATRIMKHKSPQQLSIKQLSLMLAQDLIHS